MTTVALEKADVALPTQVTAELNGVPFPFATYSTDCKSDLKLKLHVFLAVFMSLECRHTGIVF